MFETRTIESTPASTSYVPLLHSPHTLAPQAREEIARTCSWMRGHLRTQIATWCQPQAPKRETLLTPITSDAELQAVEVLATRLEDMERNVATATSGALRRQYADILHLTEGATGTLHYYRQILDWYPAFLPLGAVGIPARSDSEQLTTSRRLRGNRAP